MEAQEAAKEDFPQEHIPRIGDALSSVLTYQEKYINSIVKNFDTGRELDNIYLQSDRFRSVCEKIRIIESLFTPIAGGKNATSVSENYETVEENIEGFEEMPFSVSYSDNVFHTTQDEELVGFCKKESDGSLRWIKRDGKVLLVNRKRFEYMKKNNQSAYPMIVVSPPDDVDGNVLPTSHHVGSLVLNRIIEPQEKPLEKPKEEEKKVLIPAGV